MRRSGKLQLTRNDEQPHAAVVTGDLATGHQPAPIAPKSAKNCSENFHCESADQWATNKLVAPSLVRSLLLWLSNLAESFARYFCCPGARAALLTPPHIACMHAVDLASVPTDVLMKEVQKRSAKPNDGKRIVLIGEGAACVPACCQRVARAHGSPSHRVWQALPAAAKARSLLC